MDEEGVFICVAPFVEEARVKHIEQSYPTESLHILAASVTQVTEDGEELLHVWLKN